MLEFFKRLKMNEKMLSLTTVCFILLVTTVISFVQNIFSLDSMEFFLLMSYYVLFFGFIASFAISFVFSIVFCIKELIFRNILVFLAHILIILIALAIVLLLLFLAAQVMQYF